MHACWFLFQGVCCSTICDVCWAADLNSYVLCSLSGYCPRGYKMDDGMDSDGTHHSNGGDPRYTPDPNRSLGMPKRPVGDIIRTPATPCMLQCFEWYSAYSIGFVQLYIRSGVILDTIASLFYYIASCTNHTTVQFYLPQITHGRT
jgi:hypothetical protein